MSILCIVFGLKKGIGARKRLILFGGGVFTGLVISLVVLTGGMIGITDLGSYLSKDYRKVEGVLTIHDKMSRKTKEHNIEVNGIELINTHKSLIKHAGKEIEFFYLPRSKFIVDYRVK